MRVTAIPEDNGLSESTYEFISGTDTESQDDNYTESISESVGSLDFHRPDDVHSLAGTEHTNDNESIVDEYEPLSQSTNMVEDDGHDTTIIEQTPQPEQSWASVVEHGVQHKDNKEPGWESESESESDEEARSRSSLEYTQQSLKVPSIPTPEASGIVEKPDQGDSSEEGSKKQHKLGPGFDKWAAPFQSLETWIQESFMEYVYLSFPVMVFGLVILGLMPFLHSSQSLDVAAPHIPTATSVFTTHSTPLSLSTRRPSSTPGLSGFTGAAGLIALENALTEEWLFTGKAPELTVSKKNGGYVLHIPKTIKESWLKRDCLHFTAKRGQDDVPLNISSVDEGMLLKFPYNETHGLVKVDILTTCRPRIRKVMHLNLDKSIMKGALDRTKAFAHDIGEIVPAAAQEAERRLEEAKRSLEAASDNILTTSDSVIKDFGTRLYNAHRSLGWIKKDIRGRVVDVSHSVSKTVETMADKAKKHLAQAQTVQQQAEMTLLDAQISAKLLWLKATASKDEHDRYQLKAREFVAQKQAGSESLDKQDSTQGKVGLSWSKIFGRT